MLTKTYQLREKKNVGYKGLKLCEKKKKARATLLICFH